MEDFSTRTVLSIVQRSRRTVCDSQKRFAPTCEDLLALVTLPTFRCFVCGLNRGPPFGFHSALHLDGGRLRFPNERRKRHLGRHIGGVRVRTRVAPAQGSGAPNGCSTVSRRTRMAGGSSSGLRCSASGKPASRDRLHGPGPFAEPASDRTWATRGNKATGRPTCRDRARTHLMSARAGVPERRPEGAVCAGSGRPRPTGLC